MDQRDNMTNTYDVFISYSSVDNEKAETLKKALEGYPYCLRCWKANINTIPTGAYFKDQITDAIMRSKIVLFVLSKTSIDSNWVSMEINISVFENKTIFPIIIDDALDNSIDDKKLQLLKFKLGCSQYIFANNYPNFHDVAEKIAYDAKKSYDKTIAQTKASLIASNEFKFFPLPTLKIICRILLLICLSCIVTFMSFAISNKLNFIDIMGLESSTDMAQTFLQIFYVFIVSVTLLILFSIFTIIKQINLKPFLINLSPSALYYDFLINRSHLLFRKHYKKRAFESLEKSADLGYKKAVEKIIYMYENGKWVEKSHEIAAQYRLKL